ncbi:Uncharacterised protein [Mycobacteroides abscessus subsp. abscessus]|nr:Uncharacterised protein [Mycobacteroides abscessus subsp. abscessus]
MRLSPWVSRAKVRNASSVRFTARYRTAPATRSSREG